MDKKQIKEKLLKNKKQWAYLIGGIVCVIFGFFIASIWGTQRENMGLALMAIALWAIGAFMAYRGFKQIGDTDVVIVGTKKPDTPVNSLNIYAKKDKTTGTIYSEKIVFEMVEEPLGQPQQCTNNGRWYYVHLWNIETEALEAFALPDSQFFDPREFANVIKMPAHNKLFERQISTFQKVAPWIMVAAFGISILGLVMTTPVG